MAQPIQLSQLVNAFERQIPQASLRSALFSMSSELGFCARDDSSGQPMLRIVNLQDQALDIQISMKADAALLSPTDPTIVVLRVPTKLQAISLTTKQSLGLYQFQQPVNIEHWQWLDNERIAIVCPEAVYAWSMGSGQFVTLFNRDPQLTANLQNSRISYLQLSSDAEWAVLQVCGVDPTTQSVQGNFQLHCFSKNVSKVLPGHASTLGQYKEDDVHPACTILSYAHKQPGSTNIDVNMIEAGPQKDAQGNPLSGFTRKQFQIPVNPALVAKEFPVFMRSSVRYGFTYLMTKAGMFYVHDIGSATCIYQVSVSTQGIFAVSEAQNGEVVIAAADGAVYKLVIDPDSIVDFILSRLGKPEAAFRLAMRAGLRGADRLFTSQFENLFSQKNWREAALLVKKSPADTLRNAQTLQRFKDAGEMIQLGEKPPVLIYLGTLLEGDCPLQNEAESLELVRQFAAQGKIQAVETYMQKKQLFECEALGDVLMQSGLEKLAFRIYSNAKAHEKCIVYLIQQNQLDAIIKYCERFPEYVPDYPMIIQKGLGMGTGFSAEGIDRLRGFADSVIAKLDPVQQIQEIVGIAISFKNFGYVKEATKLLLDVCKRANFEEISGPYQTALLLINLEANSSMAEAFFAKNLLQHFDRQQIYAACEKAGLYQRAFEFADEDNECLRIAVQYGAQQAKPIFESPEWFATYMQSCGRFDVSYYNNDTQACVDQLFVFQQTLLDVMVQPSTEQEAVRIYAPHVALAFSRLPVIATSTDLIQFAVDVFTSYQLEGSEALFSFLAAIFPSSIAPSIHLMYLKCAIQLPGHDSDIVRVARESHYIDGNDAFEVLTTVHSKSESATVTALLTICSRFKLSQKLCKFLCEAIIRREKSQAFFTQNAPAIIEQYMSAFAPEEADTILQALFDNGVLSSNDVGVLDGVFSIDFLGRCLANQAVRDRCDISKVVEVCMFNSKTIRIVQLMLQERLSSGASDSVTHTSFAKILLETRATNCERFLLENPYYDHYAVCVFAIQQDKRRRDSFVQTMALKCAAVGAFDPLNPVEIRNQRCAAFIIELTFGCAMYRELSTLLLKRGSKKMWEMALRDPFEPINKEFFTMNNTRTLQQHREQFAQAVAGNNAVPVEKLDEAVIAACVGVFVEIMDADHRYSKCLMIFLERVILTQGSNHMKNSPMHNLLVVSAVKARELQKVSQFVKMTELVYDPEVVANVCISVARSQNLPQFFEDAFEVYRRFDKLTEGVQVLIKHMGLERAEKFAEGVNSPEVFVVLGTAQLEKAQEDLQAGLPMQVIANIQKAARAFIRARDGSQYRLIISAAFAFANAYSETYPNEVVQAFTVLVEFLRGARTLMFVQGKYAEHAEIDTGLLYCYVRLDKLDELDSFMQLASVMSSGVVPMKGDIAKIGDRAFGEQRYTAAKMLYSRISNWSKLALTLLKLQDYQNAVDAAKRAEDVPTWAQVNAACLLANQISLAKTAGLNLIVLPDELPKVSDFYQKNVRIAELIDLLENGIEHNQARAYTSKEQNLFTHLALIYAKYLWLTEQQGSQKLMRFLKSNSDKISIPLAIAECRKNLLWNEVVYLYILSQEFDQAASEMIKHPGSFDHRQLLQFCGQVSQPDLLIQLTEFYIDFYPQHLCEFLKVSRLGYYQTEELLDQKRKDFLSVDPAAVLRLARKHEITRLVRPYFELLVEDNMLDVNNELINIYISQRDPKALIELVKKSTAFDTYSTLDRLVDEKQSQALRRAAVTLYACLKKFDEGIEYAIKNRFYDEASQCAAASEDGAKCDQLLRLICSKQFPDANIRSEIFAVAVAHCGARARADIVMELAWRFGMMDFAMPYMIGQLKSMNDRIVELEARKPEASKQTEAQQEDGFGGFQDAAPQQEGEWVTGGSWQ